MQKQVQNNNVLLPGKEEWGFNACKQLIGFTISSHWVDG